MQPDVALLERFGPLAKEQRDHLAVLQRNARKVTLPLCSVRGPSMSSTFLVAAGPGDEQCQQRYRWSSKGIGLCGR